MTHVKRRIALWSAAILLASPAAFAIKVPTGTEDLTLNLTVLLQARVEGDFNGPARPPATVPGPAPSGHFNTDFFLRRAQLIASGTAYKYFTYYIKLDTPRFGLRGDYSGSTFVQDLYVGFVPMPDFNIEAGLLYMPLTHAALASAVSASALEGPADILLYNNAKGLRENGVQIRVLLLDRRILVRGGVYEGARTNTTAAATTPPTPPVNPQGTPQFAGMVRLNLIGDETAYFYPTLYLDGKSRVSVGVGAQYQPHSGALKDAASGSFNDYIALGADVFADYALTADSEAVLSLGGYRFDYGTGNAKTGNGLHGEVGYRFGQIEPQGNFYWFNSDTKRNSFVKGAAGLNYLFRGHQAKIGAEFAVMINNAVITDAPGRPATPALHQIIVQGQLAF